MKINRWILVAWLALLLAGCSPFTQAVQPTLSAEILLSQGETIGQTFVAHFNGLSAIGLAIDPQTTGNGILRLELRTAPDDSLSLRRSEIPLSAVASSGRTFFYFQPIDGSRQSDYYFSLRLVGSGSAKIGIAEANRYLNGALYQDGEAQDAQLNFTLVYGRRLLLSGMAGEVMQWVLWTLSGLFLFVIPGWALLDVLHPRWKMLSFWEKFGLGSGVSLAVYPLLILWTNSTGLHLGALYAWLPAVIGLVVILVRNWRRLRNFELATLRPGAANWPALILGIVAIVIFGVRYWVIRTLDFPLWGDSYQHTVIAQLIVDHGGLFDNWLPYADLQSFTYHFGFHSLAAVYHWLTQSSLPQSILWAGQILNTLAALSLYPITLRVTKNAWAGVFSVLAAGLLFTMPMVYTNWGRYTQLAGLVILSAWIVLAWETLDRKKNSWQLIFLSWLALGGLALTHYRVLIFSIIFLFSYLLLNLRSGRIVKQIARMFLLCAGAVIFTLPWYAHTFSGGLVAGFSNKLSTPAGQLTPAVLESYAIGNIFTYLPAWAWVSLPLILGWGIWKRQKGIALIGLWWFLILLAANPQWFNLPGAGILTSFAVMIAVYYPASILIGAGAGWVIDALVKDDRHKDSPGKSSSIFRNVFVPIGIILVILGSGYWGARQRVNDIAIAAHVLATRPDQRAAHWIQANLPDHSKFLVNSIFGYDGTAIAGSDGGWWLPLLANRQTSQPPLPYLSERGPSPDYPEWVNRLVSMIQEKGITDSQVLQELHQRGIEYIYIGQQQGGVNSTEPMIKLPLLLESSAFQPIYHQDRVWIFKIEPKSN
jgi:hypothetical protein